MILQLVDKSKNIRITTLFIAFLCSYSGVTAQDIITDFPMNKYVCINDNVIMALENFLKSEAYCIDSIENTSVAISCLISDEDDKRLLQFRVISERSLLTDKYVGFILFSGSKYYLHRNALKCDLFIDTGEMKNIRVSNKVAFGNYVFNYTDTMYIDPQPFEAIWSYWINDHNELSQGPFDIVPCKFHLHELKIDSLKSEGWLIPSCE